MVKVIKRNKKAQPFSSAKIIKSCKKAGMPEPIAKAIAQMVFAKVKKKKTVTSTAIMKMIFDICKKMGKVPDGWKKYEKAKRKKRAAAKKKKAKKKKPAKKKPAKKKASKKAVKKKPARKKAAKKKAAKKKAAKKRR